tara:strand:- start:500 stop:688 length:189 start_codon:yes stop_codon:yes gene_type:complete
LKITNADKRWPEYGVGNFSNDLRDHGGSGRLDEQGFVVALSCRNTHFPKTLLRRLANCPRLA